MPARRLPSDPNLENLRKQAKQLHRGARAGDPEAGSLVREFHPRDVALAELSRADAQLALGPLLRFPQLATADRAPDPGGPLHARAAP
ncbi:hypothetical protein [Pseudonocardia acaciae]|uniref:hypothetical protein n=1 Tax=Pseudonocardia acaciae TaxID=551276 RepID=UPI001B80A952|nr:hypothetical protein [Pseudonocardia acaciae]